VGRRNRDPATLSDVDALARLLDGALADKPQIGRALLGALLVEAETPPVRPNVLGAIREALMRLIENVGATHLAAELGSGIDAVLRNAPLPHVEADPQERYSLGPRAVQIVVRLRYEFGLPVPSVHRHLHDSWGFGSRMPHDQLRRAIILVPPPARPRRR